MSKTKPHRVWTVAEAKARLPVFCALRKRRIPNILERENHWLSCLPRRGLSVRRRVHSLANG